jgi:hypothetical protein
VDHPHFAVAVNLSVAVGDLIDGPAPAPPDKRKAQRERENSLE